MRELILEQLVRMLASDTFAGPERSRVLLRFIVEHAVFVFMCPPFADRGEPRSRAPFCVGRERWAVGPWAQDAVRLRRREAPHGTPPHVPSRINDLARASDRASDGHLRHTGGRNELNEGEVEDLVTARRVRVVIWGQALTIRRVKEQRSAVTTNGVDVNRLTATVDPDQREWAR